MIRSRQYPGTKPAGDGDVDVPVEEIEMILPSLHTKDRKGSITSAWEIFASEQRQATGSLPSSCGWTFLLFVYAILVISLLSLLRVTPSVTLHLFHLYYQPLLPPIFMLFLWGIAVRYFEDHGIQYELCFGKEDRKYLLASTAIFYLSLILSLFVFLSGCAFLYLSLSGFQGVAAWQPTLVYAGLLAALLLPHPFLYQDTRRFFTLTMWRVMIPIRTVTWADFLLADILTSLAKPLSDAERAVSRMVTWDSQIQVLHESDAHDGASLLVPTFLAVPYLSRLFQCIKVYHETGNPSHIMNALKYFSALPVILLSSTKYHVPQEAWHQTYKPLWLLMALVNSAFSYYWDVERDWELPLFSQFRVEAQTSTTNRMLIHTSALYKGSFYIYLMTSNAFLRLSWIYKLSPHLRHNYVAVFVIVLAESVRRFQWIFVRIEVELRKIHNSSQFSASYLPLVAKRSTP